MTNKELGAAIRAKIKAAGIPAKAVSVTVKDAGYSTSVRIKIKDITVGRKRVEKLANGYEEIRYDERSYEILEGANTYVFVDYDYDAMRAAAAAYMDRAREIIENHPERYQGVEVARNEESGTHLSYFWHGEGYNDNTVQVFDEKEGRFTYDGGRYSAYNEHVLAEALAIYAAHGTFAA